MPIELSPRGDATRAVVLPSATETLLDQSTLSPRQTVLVQLAAGQFDDARASAQGLENFGFLETLLDQDPQAAALPSDDKPLDADNYVDACCAVGVGIASQGDMELARTHFYSAWEVIQREEILDIRLEMECDFAELVDMAGFDAEDVYREVIEQSIQGRDDWWRGMQGPQPEEILTRAVVGLYDRGYLEAGLETAQRVDEVLRVQPNVVIPVAPLRERVLAAKKDALLGASETSSDDLGTTHKLTLKRDDKTIIVIAHASRDPRVEAFLDSCEETDSLIWVAEELEADPDLDSQLSDLLRPALSSDGLSAEVRQDDTRLACETETVLCDEINYLRTMVFFQMESKDDIRVIGLGYDLGRNDQGDLAYAALSQAAELAVTRPAQRQ